MRVRLCLFIVNDTYYKEVDLPALPRNGDAMFFDEELRNCDSFVVTSVEFCPFRQPIQIDINLEATSKRPDEDLVLNAGWERL